MREYRLSIDLKDAEISLDNPGSQGASKNPGL